MSFENDSKKKIEDVYCYKCGAKWALPTETYGMKPTCDCGEGGYSGKPVEAYIKNLPLDWDCMKYLKK